MNIESIKLIYRRGVTSSEPLGDEYLSLYDQGEYYNLLKSDLSINEMKLLSSLFNDKIQRSELYEYLHEDKEYSLDSIDKIQAIHFRLNKALENKDEWLLSFSSFFTHIIDYYFINSTEGVLLVNKLDIENKELTDMLGILEEDYSIIINLYIGQKVEFFKFKEIYQEEVSIFRNSNGYYKISSFIDAYIDEYVVKSLLTSENARYMRDILLSQNELKSLIVSLWNNQGNQSKVAKDIYVHRNTITYRLDKLCDDYQINLRDMEQLFLAYLLVR